MVAPEKMRRRGDGWHVGATNGFIATGRTPGNIGDGRARIYTAKQAGQ